MNHAAGSTGAAASENALAQVLFDDANPDLAGFAQVPPQLVPEWGHEQRKLAVRWQSLEPSDFSAARGERSRFVDRLAYRENLSRDEAARELSAFEAGEPIGWRPEEAALGAAEHYVDQTVATNDAGIASRPLNSNVQES